MQRRCTGQDGRSIGAWSGSSRRRRYIGRDHANRQDRCMSESISPDRLVLHGSFTSSSSYKPMLFLALSGLPFSFRTVNLKNGVQKQPAHLAINRYGQVPVLKHRGLTLVMSNVILDYLARTTGKFEGASEQDRIHAREWLSWENDAIQNVARVRHFARFRPDVSQDIVNYFRPGAEAALDFLDKSLE